MEKIDAPCPSCSPLEPVPHVILKGERDILLQCESCRSVHREKKPKKIMVRVIVSRGEKAIHASAMLSGIISKNDELVIDDEKTGEAVLVKVTSLEVGDKRKDSAAAEDITTLWARAIDEVVVKIAVSRGGITESLELRVPGEQEFVIGDKVKVNSRELKIIRIKIRDEGFKSRKGVAVRAKDIRRIYADSGIREQKIRRAGAGERVVIKKRESVWSLKSKRTT